MIRTRKIKKAIIIKTKEKYISSFFIGSHDQSLNCNVKKRNTVEDVKDDLWNNTRHLKPLTTFSLCYGSSYIFISTVLKLVFGLLSKSTIALAFMAAYMWSSEIFPTVVRYSYTFFIFIVYIIFIILIIFFRYFTIYSTFFIYWEQNILITKVSHRLTNSWNL